MKIRMCFRCGAVVFWATSGSHHQVPLDVGPSADGLFVVTYSIGRHTYAERFDPKKHVPETPRFRSHFVTCPHAEEWGEEDWNV